MILRGMSRIWLQSFSRHSTVIVSGWRSDSRRFVWLDVGQPFSDAWSLHSSHESYPHKVQIDRQHWTSVPIINRDLHWKVPLMSVGFDTGQHWKHGSSHELIPRVSNNNYSGPFVTIDTAKNISTVIWILKSGFPKDMERCFIVIKILSINFTSNIENTNFWIDKLKF